MREDEKECRRGEEKEEEWRKREEEKECRRGEYNTRKYVRRLQRRSGKSVDVKNFRKPSNRLSETETSS